MALPYTQDEIVRSVTTQGLKRRNKMAENKVWRCDDEPPSKIQAAKIGNHSDRCFNHTLGDLHRLLLLRGTLQHRRGDLECAGRDFSDRWLYLVLGDGEYEGKNG